MQNYKKDILKFMKGGIMTKISASEKITRKNMNMTKKEILENLRKKRKKN